MLDDYGGQDPTDALVTTLADERRINTFLRLQNPTIIAQLCDEFPELGPAPDAKSVFLKLRELRNRW